MSEQHIGELTGEVFEEIFHTKDDLGTSLVVTRGTKVMPGHFALTIIEGRRALTVALCPHAVEELVARIGKANGA